jgi:hypothetical protein
MSTDTNIKLVTLFGSVCEVTNEPVIINGEVTKSVVILKSIKTGDKYWVLRKTVDKLPETIRRDSFVYKPQ